MPAYYRVLIADSDLASRERLAAAVEGERDMVVVARASSGPQAVAQCLLGKPDAVLIALQMPAAEGASVVAAIASNLPDAAVIYLTTGCLELGFDPMEAGAKACLQNDAPRQEVVDAIRRASGANGEVRQETHHQSPA